MNKNQYRLVPHPLMYRYSKQSKFGLKIALSFTIIGLSSLSITQVFAQDTVQRPSEMEFDARVIQGQRAEGAVYLFQRATRSLPPLLKYKRDYLSAIVSPVFSQNTALGKKLKDKAKQGHLEIGQKTTATEVPTQANTPVQKKSTSKASTKSRRAWRKSKRKSQPKRRGRK